MYSLPNEIIIEIFNHIPKITDRRQFLRTCSLYNNLTKQSFLNYENNYKVNDFIMPRTYGVEKFTLELCHDGYFNLITDDYITISNANLIECLSYYNCVSLLDVAKHKGLRLTGIMMYGSLGGNIEILSYGLSNDYKLSPYDGAQAALRGHLSTVKWFHENGCGWSYYYCRYSALNGHLSVLKWVHENGAPWDEGTCFDAALHGQLDCLQYAHENGCPWDQRTCSNAALQGKLSCLKYAYENGCIWDSRICANAAKNGHLDCLKYARENGCLWNNEVTLIAKIWNYCNGQLIMVVQFNIYL